MALYHFHVEQIKRSVGQSAIAAAAYRAGEKLYSEYYGETNDFTRKGGVLHTEILLPPNAPRSYSDRQTLWNAVERAEKNKKAQLAYSFDIALQNELTMDENIALARRFVQEHFVVKGMIADLAVHEPDKENGIPNPHFHVLTTMRPLNPDGSWGNKQRRDYALDENGERIRDEKGEYMKYLFHPNEPLFLYRLFHCHIRLFDYRLFMGSKQSFLLDGLGKYTSSPAYREHGSSLLKAFPVRTL